MIKPLSLGMQRLLLAASILVFLAGFQLFILTEHTDSYFAWTIQPPLTAAFLGASYFSSFLLEFLASRETEWAKGRIAVPAIFVFTTLTLIATLLHADRFHFNSPESIARFAAWFWLAIYAIVPPAMLAIWIRQRLIQGEDSHRSLPLPAVMRIVLATQSIIMLAVGVGLFALPDPVAAFWPWKLTALTSRAIGAWLIGIGIVALHSVVENDFARVKAGLVSCLSLGLLQLIALVRYPANADWTKLSAWLYLLFIFSLLLVGLYGCLRWRRNLFGEFRG
jgi:hypothetical protein